MTIKIPDKLVEGLKNWHVSVPALLGASTELIHIWNPLWYAQHQQQIKATRDLLFSYGMIAASTLGGSKAGPADGDAAAAPAPPERPSILKK